MKSRMGWLRHVLTVLAVAIFILGCFVIGYMAWVLATAVTVTRFLEGSLIFTYILIGIGFAFFFSGLIGWVGGSSESPFFVRLFLITCVLSIVAELGGLIAINVMSLEFDDILHTGWQEVNQGSRNLVQKNLNCCGWDGPKEFAYNNEPIDETCYEKVATQLANSGVWPRRRADDRRGSDGYNGGNGADQPVPVKKMKQDGCRLRLNEWFDDNKITWATILASVIALQVMCMGIAMYILSRVKKMRKLRKSRTASKRHLYDTSSEGSNDYRPSRI